MASLRLHCSDRRRGSCPFGASPSANLIKAAALRGRRGSKDSAVSVIHEHLDDHESEASGSGSSASGSGSDDDNEAAADNADRLVVLSWTRAAVSEEEADARSRRRSVESAQSRRTIDDHGPVSPSAHSSKDSDDDISDYTGQPEDVSGEFSNAVKRSAAIESKRHGRPTDMPQAPALLCEDGENGNADSERVVVTSTSDAAHLRGVTVTRKDDTGSLLRRRSVRPVGGDVKQDAIKRECVNVNADSERSANASQYRSARSIAAATARVRSHLVRVYLPVHYQC